MSHTPCFFRCIVSSIVFIFFFLLFLSSQLSSLAAQLNDLYQSTGGTVVLFSWVQFLKDETLSFLGIHNVLDIPSDGQTKTPESTEHTSEEPLKHEVSLNKDDQKTKSLSKAGNDDELISQSKNYLSLEKKSAKEASLSDCASPTSMSSLTQSQNDGEATNAAKIKPQTPLSSLSPGQALMSQLLIDLRRCAEGEGVLHFGLRLWGVFYELAWL